MNTIPETIPTAFGPETAFVLSLRPTDRHEPSPRTEFPVHIESERSHYPIREWRGIPDSALND